ncbi:GAS2-like protein 3 [Trichechus manatus latirostris]|uniref:GAS2-like protein 3 n=1 Tax=Trichechus manatus latirostris TaxID=127582 RepID=A0A2Y9QZA5_TRIMA|nr:GAS2-like protein 3 [Trichechus manatus latirostris]
MSSLNICQVKVKHIAEDPPCSCSHRFSIEYLSEGRYRLGDKILFIRVSPQFIFYFKYKYCFEIGFIAFPTSFCFLFTFLKIAVEGVIKGRILLYRKNIEYLHKPSPSFQAPAKLTKSSSKSTAARSQPPDGAPQAGANTAQKLKSTLNLNQPICMSSISPAKASQELKDKQLVSVAKKQPQNKSTRQQTGPSSSRSPGRTPLAIVSLPQSSAKTQTVTKSAQTASKGQCSAEGPPKSVKAPASTRKPPSSGKEAVSGDKKPTAKKKEDDDHYFVMTGSKKPRK